MMWSGGTARLCQGGTARGRCSSHWPRQGAHTCACQDHWVHTSMHVGQTEATALCSVHNGGVVRQVGEHVLGQGLHLMTAEISGAIGAAQCTRITSLAPHCCQRLAPNSQLTEVWGAVEHAVGQILDARTQKRAATRNMVQGAGYAFPLPCHGRPTYRKSKSGWLASKPTGSVCTGLPRKPLWISRRAV